MPEKNEGVTIVLNEIIVQVGYEGGGPLTRNEIHGLVKRMEEPQFRERLEIFIKENLADQICEVDHLKIEGQNVGR